MYPLRRDLIEEVEMTKCPFCRIVKHMVLSTFDRVRISNIVKRDYNLNLYLRSSEEQTSSTVAADIYIQYLDGSGVSNEWVGDLYISDTNNCKSVT